MNRLCAVLVGLLLCCHFTAALQGAEKRPNVLIAISDDQSYPHTSAYGYAAISTPSFDRVARAGALFHNAFAPAPGCSPMRAAFLTGRNIWQIENAGTHASSFPKKYEVFQDRLEQSGYFVGFTGKGWGPGNWEASGRPRNPAGTMFSEIKAKTPPGIRNIDYAANFAHFLSKRPKDQPFSFWYGASEPHRVFEKGIGRKHGLDPAKVVVPPFLPDTPEIRDDLLDYCFEIEWFDQHLGRMLDLLEEAGELENTIVIVTSDNGMSFPAAKANAYEYGIHLPLAIAWPERFGGEQSIADLVNLIDVTATIYEATGVEPPQKFPPAGRSLLTRLTTGADPQPRTAVYSGRERHSSSRYHSLGYPQRCVRTADYLYIRNFRPERWPAGTPQKYNSVTYGPDGNILASELGPSHGGYHDIDACPTLDFLIAHRDEPEIAPYFQHAVSRRPAEELFDIRADPGCMKNLAEDANYADTKKQLAEQLENYLRATEDARVTSADGGDIWETYPRYSKLRWFPEPDWAKSHPERAPRQDWVRQRRPK